MPRLLLALAVALSPAAPSWGALREAPPSPARAQAAAPAPGLPLPAFLLQPPNASHQEPFAALPQAQVLLEPAAAPSAPPESAGAPARRLMDGAGPTRPEAPPVFAAPVSAPVPSLPPSASGLGPRPPGEPPGHTYLITEPLEATVRLGPLAQVLHYVLEVAFQVLKAYLMWTAGAPAPAAGAYLFFELLKAPPMIAAQSMADLRLRYYFLRRSALKPLSRLPGVEKIQVLTASETRFKGLVAAQEDFRGLVFLRSSEPLPEGVPAMHIEDAWRTRLHLSFEVGGKTLPLRWSARLNEVLGRERIPVLVAEAWRGAVTRYLKTRPWKERLLGYGLEKSLRIHTELADASGRTFSLGVLARGGSARRLLRASLTDEAWDAVGRFLGLDAPLPERSVPLSEHKPLRLPLGPRP